MSKLIKLPDDLRQQYVDAYAAELKKLRFSDGTGTMTSKITVPDAEKQHATVKFTPLAWGKMLMLVFGYSSEVAWHGVGRRGNEEQNEYLIEDILVYPQSVTGAYVDMDHEGYNKWIFDNRDNEQFANIRLQGHSHVNMPVSPSGTDLNHFKELLSGIAPDEFYICTIWNKSLNHNTRIFDMKKNIFFEPGEVDCVLDVPGGNMEEFIKTCSEMVKKKTTYYGGYYGGNYNSAGAQGSLYDVTKLGKQEEKKSDKKTETPKLEAPKNKKTTVQGMGWQGKSSQINTDVFGCNGKSCDECSTFECMYS